MLIIGEKINATSKQVAQAIEGRDNAFIQGLAQQQTEAGADYIDINAGTGQGAEQEIADLIWAMETVRAVVDAPLCIDSSDPQALKAALSHYQGKPPIINSVNGEEERLAALLPLARESGADIIALAMDESGVPRGMEQRLQVCERILERADSCGLPRERIFIDPLALPLSVDTEQGMVSLHTLEQVKARYPGVKTTIGLSNISYGLPLRGEINRALLSMAVYLGIDSVIMDPMDDRMMAQLKAAQAVAGHDPFCRGFLNYYRRGRS